MTRMHKHELSPHTAKPGAPMQAPRVRLLPIIAVVLVSGCKDSTPVPLQKAQPTRAPRRADMDDFFVTWFKGHGHGDVVVDADGVGVGNNATRLQASLYGSKQQEKGF